MYLVRKRFMYWQVPAVTRVCLERDPSQGIYCFYPARLIKMVKKVVNVLVLKHYPPVGKTLRDRSITIRG
ncbi:hypothetical protein GZ77_13945 [Endozoicomonas montiporae]|uniref:Uncharacterized protein n=2 Tax=Endozoicomonas montiporae TaxID=1027273 RepID=A0A081N4U4_9GAMM|nr:hypothetical protein [Endozoicomonas montiporae]AMO57661.1 hypothetical protein EZMO1_3701 [Endozoicomonas montiporae CL-33]KEQ13467.1 hypothetical protein GZ77_13945 [Endozoicomonas montiporae]